MHGAIHTTKLNLIVAWNRYEHIKLKVNSIFIRRVHDYFAGFFKFCFFVFFRARKLLHDNRDLSFKYC